MESSSGGHNIPRIMVFKPTWEEFKDFNKYVALIESKGAHKAGICKIIPPKEWVPRRRGYDDLKVTIPAPIQQIVHGKQGFFTQFNVQKKPLQLNEFVKLANSHRFQPPPHEDYDDLERKFWKNLTFLNPIYGADVPGTATDASQKHWNIQKLGSILDCLGDDYGVSIEGVNTAYLYFGMWKTTFAWHTEDMDLYSINYIHYGAAKRWYGIPPEHGRRLERLAAGFFPDSYDQCPAFLRHKMTLISPAMLKKYSIPYDTVTQDAGEIIITFPYGYHSGFNHGYNCAESTNFASKRWIEYGKRCLQCHCRGDSVKIDMGTFVKRFQPKLYNAWINGEDNAPHPEDDQSKLYNHNQPSICSETSKSPCQTLRRHPFTKSGSVHMSRIGRSNKRPSTEPVHSGESKKRKKSKSDKEKLKSETHKKSSKSPKRPKVVISSSGDESSDDTPRPAKKHRKHKLKKKTSREKIKEPQETPVEPEVKTEAQVPPESESLSSESECDILVKLDHSWAESLTKLWKFNPAHFISERRFNMKQSVIYPYCAVCQIINNKSVRKHLRDQPSVKAPPRQSVPLIPQYIFTGIQPTEDQGHGNPENMPTSKEKLVVCAKCNLCVHDTCYGSKPLRDSWICDRCASPDDSRNGIACCLCSLRGGALKQTTKGRWAHITCTLANNELLFTENRETIDLKKIDKQRYTLKCTYCGLITYKQGKDRYGACVQCTTGSCKKSFHLSCAQRAGLSIDIGKTPFRLSIACTKHKSSPNDQPMTKSDRPPIRPGSAVYARHKNSRYYSGSVRKIHNQLYYCVVFDDNSISRDLYPSDVTNFKARDGPPPLGSVVRVKWSDGVIYNGHFQGTRNVNLYTVEFEDGSEIQVEKEHVYTVEENLPHHVHKKLSVATEMKEDVFYKTEEELITDKRTRGVQVNYMYRFLNY